jgi:hypothetical protein
MTGVQFMEEAGIFPSIAVSLLGVRPAQPPVWWVPRNLSLGVGWPNCGAGHLSLMLRLGVHGADPLFHNTSSWLGVWLSTGTTLPLPLPLHVLSQKVYSSLGNQCFYGVTNFF